MGYLSCRADSSIATCRSISTLNHHHPSNEAAAAPEEEGSDQPQIRHFTYRELESATGNFSDAALLGRGSHGAVYKAVLRRGGGGGTVAVKRPSRRPAASRDEVENEIDILSRIRSPRFVNLIGFTPPSASNSRLLVLEFMPNGTLYDLLHSNGRPPGWSRRLRLALQISKALLTLHSARPPVIHRDVKSANVLIDRQSNARLCDFGLALVAGGAGTTPPAGTLGYLDPCYVTPENLSTKTDVFSFGILLLEIMSGRKAIDVAHSPPSVVEWAVPLLKRGKVSTLFDPRIGIPRDPAVRRKLASLAASCVKSCKERRPSMEEVVEQLKLLGKTVTARAWNGLSIVNPCSVVDTEGTLSRLGSNSLNLDPGSSTSLAGLEDPTSRPLRITNNVFSSPMPHISRSRTLQVSAAGDYCDMDGVLRLRRNHTLKGAPFERFSRLGGDGLENLEGKSRVRALNDGLENLEGKSRVRKLNDGLENAEGKSRVRALSDGLGNLERKSRVRALNDVLENLEGKSRVRALNDGHENLEGKSRVRALNDGHENLEGRSRVRALNDGLENLEGKSRVRALNDRLENLEGKSRVRVLNDGLENLEEKSRVRALNDGLENLEVKSRVRALNDGLENLEAKSRGQALKVL